MSCEPLKHDWEVIEVSSDNPYHSRPNEKTIIKFRCRKCLASITGEIEK